MNGLKNSAVSLDGISTPHTNFVRVLVLMRNIQISGAVGMRIETNDQKEDATIVTLRAANISQKTLDDIREVRQLLHLNPDASEFKLVFEATTKRSPCRRA